MSKTSYLLLFSDICSDFYSDFISDFGSDFFSDFSLRAKASNIMRLREAFLTWRTCRQTWNRILIKFKKNPARLPSAQKESHSNWPAKSALSAEKQSTKKN